MRRCSTPDCAGVPVIQWQRRTTDEETAAHIDSIRARIVENNDNRRLRLRLHIAELEQVRDTLPPTLSPQDRERLIAQAGKQIDAARDEHNQIRDDVNLDHHAADSSTAVYACEQHKPEPDWAAILHDATCDGTAGCGCQP